MNQLTNDLMLKIIAAIGSIQVLAILVGLIRSKIIALLLGPAGVGIITIVDPSAQLVAHVSAFSLPFAAVKFLSRFQRRMIHLC